MGGVKGEELESVVNFFLQGKCPGEQDFVGGELAGVVLAQVSQELPGKARKRNIF